MSPKFSSIILFLGFLLFLLLVEISSLNLSEVLFRSNSDPFRDSINLSNNSGTSTGPRITSAGDNVYVVWEDNTLGNYEVFLEQVMIMDEHLAI